MTDQAPAADQSETDDVIARLKALSAANVGRTASDDEAIDGVCESAVEELERLRGIILWLQVRVPPIYAHYVDALLNGSMVAPTDVRAKLEAAAIKAL